MRLRFLAEPVGGWGPMGPISEAHRTMPRRQFPDEPLRPDDTFRVYHGFAETKHAIYAARHGISGKQRIPRRYSYENNNNPHGLFVTISLERAREFSSAMDLAVIMEFVAKASDMEPPVWPGGSYTVQGQMEEFWQSDEERAEGLRKKREQLSQSKHPFVAQSFDPALAFSLYGDREMQALFVGDLNPNQIKRFWIREPTSDGYQRVTDPFVPMSRRRFLAYLEKHPELVERHTTQIRRHWKTGEAERYPDEDEPKNKLFRPNEEFDSDLFLHRLYAKYPQKDSVNLSFLAKEVSENPDAFDLYFRRFVWPKQEAGLRRFLEALL